MPRVAKEVLEAFMDVLQVFISDRTGARLMEERVGVAWLIPDECVQRAVDEIVDNLVGVIKWIPQERVSNRIV